jgi:[ribosomal protein S5]-alanine N-acetyltransferase
MQIQTGLSNCCIRSWQPGDKLDLVRNANNLKIWLNLTDRFPHPCTEIDAENWIQSANRSTLNTHLAIEFEGIAVGGIGIIAEEPEFFARREILDTGLANLFGAKGLQRRQVTRW